MARGLLARARRRPQPRRRPYQPRLPLLLVLLLLLLHAGAVAVASSATATETGTQEAGEPATPWCLGEGHVAGCAEVAPDSAAAAAGAEAALRLLRGMSESSVYETLQIARVLSARLGPGRFHDNLVLECELRSDAAPGLAWRAELVVMRDPVTQAVESVSVDRLPEFPADVVRAFQSRRVARARADREKLFAELERGFAREQAQALADMQDEDARRAELRAMPEQLLRDVRAAVLGDPALAELRALVDTALRECAAL
jgi:hypothetical protein